MNTKQRATYDLHLHTYWSYDALATPKSYFEAAVEYGLRCIAITEHHVLDSQPALAEIAPAYPTVSCIRAGEFTVTTSLGSVDLVCLGFPRDVPPELQHVLDAYHQWQRDYGSALCRGTQALGIDYTDADRRALLRTYRPAETLQVQGDTHVRASVQREYFLKRGFVSSAEEYSKLLARVRETTELPPYPSVETVVPVFKKLGVLIALAHPHLYCKPTNIEPLETLRSECQLDGIECAHTTMPEEFPQILRRYCLEHGLFSCAGSDCHLESEIPEIFAAHGGEEEWLDELLDRLPQDAFITS